MIFGAFLIMGSCGPSVSVTDAWKAPDISESKRIILLSWQEWMMWLEDNALNKKL